MMRVISILCIRTHAYALACARRDRNANHPHRLITLITPLTPARSGVAEQHRMMTAFPSREVARRRGMNRNHDVRVWCTCMADVRDPGYYSVRPRREWEPDPRRGGLWDDLGFVDVRVPGSALDLWRRHVEASDGVL